MCIVPLEKPLVSCIASSSASFRCLLLLRRNQHHVKIQPATKQNKGTRTPTSMEIRSESDTPPPDVVFVGKAEGSSEGNVDVVEDFVGVPASVGSEVTPVPNCRSN